MKSRRRHLLIAVSCLTFVYPLEIQVEIAKSGNLTLGGASAIAREGNNGGGRGNGRGGDNGNSGGNGNAGNSGNNGNAGGNGTSGRSEAAGPAGNNGNGRGNGNGANASNGNGPGAGNANAGQGNSGARGSSSSQGTTSSPASSPSQGSSANRDTSSEQTKTTNNGKALGRTVAASSVKNQSPPAVTGGLSALFGAISNSLRPLTPPPAASAEKAKARANVTKTKSTSTTARSKQSTANAGQRTKGQAAPASTDARSTNQGWSADRKTSAAPADQSLARPLRAQHSLVAVGLTSSGLARLSAQGFRMEKQTKGSLASVVQLIPPRGMSLDQAQRKVRTADGSATVDLDHYYYTDEGPADCTGPSCEAISLVGWSVSASEQCSPAATIGMIDTGINRDHEALKGQSVEILSDLGLRGSPSQRDHGTAIAALLVGKNGSSTPGLLPDAHLLAVDAFYRDGGTADRTDVVTLVRALEALAERNVRIVNMSLSGPPNEVLKRAIASAQAKGMIIFAAAGNNGAGAEPSYPAAYPGVIAVTAIDKKLAVYARATQGDYIDIAAPGVDLWVASSDGGTVRSGTSYAVPFVTAAAAILSASRASLSARDLQSILESSTLDLGAPGRDKTYGYGLLQAENLCAPGQEKTPVAHSTIGSGADLP
ncbi:S8 family serine peptidase [Microvirga lotononidis]|uniref:Subtilisin-like serine protease n=1 Tax=Microvirga lotononidis TaxID=864069 RepID=I4YLG9_9HYPH|nr:S8 family serine peptidase [Microvirga lotononidis]EIM24811.1 subtilisin-like serine protease [Microvirga lotononidis]WQO29685.1 S8 family serine peptidase [Microvirga lotononidis]